MNLRTEDGLRSRRPKQTPKVRIAKCAAPSKKPKCAKLLTADFRAASNQLPFKATPRRKTASEKQVRNQTLGR